MMVLLGFLSEAALPGAQAGAAVTRRARVAAAATDRITDPQRLLPAGWRRSRDRSVALAGDATGLHVLAASAADGYAWKTVATLAVRGTDTSQWIGQACLTGSGDRAVVVYAPRQITNTPDAMGYGALAAVVNLATGRVTQLGAGVSIAYFDPGCGTGQDAVLTQGGTGASPQPGPLTTRLIMLNTATGKIVSAVTVPGQVTAAVPVGSSIAGVRGDDLVSVGRGGTRVLTSVRGQAFELAPDADGGIGFLVASGGRAQVRRWAGGRGELIGTAPLGDVGLSQVGGRVFVTGPHASGLGRLPATWRALDVTAGAQASSTGMLAVPQATTDRYAKARPAVGTTPDQSQPVQITAQVGASGRTVRFTVPAAGPQSPGAILPSALPSALQSGLPGAASPGRARASNVNPATTTYDPDRSCSVARNDPHVQTYQPSAQQVEWAADQAVLGHLTARQPANLYGSGLPSYSPQGLFPPPGLAGGGQVPAQVLLGILAQESNEDQASDHSIIGQTGNFSASYNWYGDQGTFTRVDWADSDCGYGIAQVTTGMCRAGYYHCQGALPYEKQLAVAVDYEANIAAGLQILGQKWNQLHGLKIIANGGNSKYIESWWFALWAYNSGLEPNAANGNKTGCSPSPKCHDSAGNWGLGWTDNPANPIYPPDRPMFLAKGPSGSKYNYDWDEAHPAGWSYEEKVVGFAAFGLLSYSYIHATWGQAFALANYPDIGGHGRDPQVDQPAHGLFCSTAKKTDDHCQASGKTRGCQLRAGATADHCWWHWPVTWRPHCPDICGTAVITYEPGAARPGFPGVPPGYAPECDSRPLPARAVIVGDTASGIPGPLGCGTSWHTNGGTMTWRFAAARTKPATYPSKIDFHQSGGGYSGHFWFTHAIPSLNADIGGSEQPRHSVADLEVTGTWTPPRSVSGWTRILVAIPDEGAWNPDASYRISLGGGKTEYRVVNQAYQADTWVSLGFFRLSHGASVSLSNVTWRGSGDDIAWDAMAFVPASAPTADYAAVGDSYTSAEGLAPYLASSDYDYSGMMNDCHRSAAQGYPDLIRMPGQHATIVQQASNDSGRVQFSDLACTGISAPDITQHAVDEKKGPSSAWYHWDQLGYTFWNSGNVGYAGPPIYNALVKSTIDATSTELPQADQGWLSPTTTLVTITEGGNDARFSQVLAACVETNEKAPLIGCSGKQYYMTQPNGVRDPEPLYKFEPKVLSALGWHLRKSYQAIAAAAPHAEIVVLGYPRLFPGDTSPLRPCNVGLKSIFGVADMTMLNKFGDDLDNQISAAVSAERHAGVNIHYVNPNPGFANHFICSAEPWINGVVAKEDSHAGTSIPGHDSFHLMAAGQNEYATLVNECLAGKLPAAYGQC